MKERYAQLTPREREVMALVVVGLLNKQIAGELCISEITVKAHRGCMMRKMKADSLAELVNMAARLRLPRSPAAGASASRQPFRFAAIEHCDVLCVIQAFTGPVMLKVGSDISCSETHGMSEGVGPFDP